MEWSYAFRNNNVWQKRSDIAQDAVQKAFVVLPKNAAVHRVYEADDSQCDSVQQTLAFWDSNRYASTLQHLVSNLH